MVVFNDRIAARFLQATVVWGLLGLLAGLFVCVERLHWPANGGLAFLTFGRLQTVYTTIMVYAWAANAFFAGLYYALQRLCQTRLWSQSLGAVHFWSWQVALLAAVISLFLGFNQGRPLAEMEWPFDILLLISWLLLTFNVFMTLKQRLVRYLYISIWFFLATLLSFPFLHTINALCYPMQSGRSYPLVPGITDALLQLWYEQNVTLFLLVVPFLGLMYYFVPKAARQPVYSHRLALMQFWSLIAVAVWVGPREGLYTSFPEWLQSLGVVAGLLLLAPLLGAVVNGLATFGAEAKRILIKPILSFFALALIALGLSAGAEALTSFKSIHLFLQYTDWQVARRELLLFGWVASFVLGMAYGLVPKIWGTRLFSQPLAIIHVWVHALAVLLLVLPMVIAGFGQAMGWQARHEDGALVYSQFLFAPKWMKSLQIWHLLGYLLLLIGVLLAVYNLYRTARAGVLQDESLSAQGDDRQEMGLWPLCLGIVGVLLLGSVSEILPLYWQQLSPSTDPAPQSYSALELQGRAIYLREGCVQCHTQMVRWSLKEELRYGPASQAWEYQFQGPPLWGQKRFGPDLHRVGGKYPDHWHFQHLVNPRSMIANSTTPAYPWLQKARLKNKDFPPEQWQADAVKIQEQLTQSGVTVEADTEIVAMIAYLQRLGTDKKR